MAEFKIKIADGVKLTYGEKVFISEGMRSIWECFGWDIDNDPNAEECANIITRTLFGMGYMDITEASEEGIKTELEIIPVGKWGEVLADGAIVLD